MKKVEKENSVTYYDSYKIEGNEEDYILTYRMEKKNDGGYFVSWQIMTEDGIRMASSNGLTETYSNGPVFAKKEAEPEVYSKIFEIKDDLDLPENIKMKIHEGEVPADSIHGQEF